MKPSRSLGLLAVAALVAATSSCVQSGTQTQPAAKQPSLSFGSKVVVGLTTDLPGWSTFTPGTNAQEGFDVALMRWLALQLNFVPIPTEVRLADRQAALENGTVQVMLANYSITDERKKHVTFAGPYVINQQGVMVLASDNRIRRLDDLADKTVCAAAGTTSLDALKEIKITRTLEPDGFQECVDDLIAGKTDAVSTDQLSLRAWAQNDKRLKILDIQFGASDRYAIGLPKGDVVDCRILVEQLKTLIDSNKWDELFGQYFKYEPPESHRPRDFDKCE
jgi:glutamate transport system substrate-binding protein